ncbi:MAG: hypothetical protein HY211_03695 [Candidatus Omnitrophica bacterium]|nr:hypothetical protein [Candidatus Omnitrophota bacterium]
MDADKVKVGFVQINASHSGQNYIPLSAGTLQAYAEKTIPNLERYEFMPPIYKRVAVDEAVAQLLGASIVGFSVYVWNFNVSVAIAKKLKALSPATVIVFGGPHVPDRFERKKPAVPFKKDDEAELKLYLERFPFLREDGDNVSYFLRNESLIEADTRRTESFMRAHPFIDIACHGEGERVFRALLENVFSDRQKIPSISYMDEAGKFVQTPRIPRMANLDRLASPYLEGTFDLLMARNPEEQWIVLWETNRGCPFTCAWCDWGSATSASVNRFDMERLYKEIDWFVDHRIEFVFCGDANFGILERDVDIANRLVDAKKRSGYPQRFAMQSTKNLKERSFDLQKMLTDAGMNNGVVVAMQSMNPPTLEAVGRKNISLDGYKENMTRFVRADIETLTDLIIAQPLETYETWVRGVDELLNLGQHNRINFNTLSVLPNTPFADPRYLEKYSIQTVTCASVNSHGSLPKGSEITESQDYVIATSTCSREDWVRMRAFSWMVALLHYNKLLQIPIIILRHAAHLSYGEILEFFAGAKFNDLKAGAFPLLTGIKEFFFAKARGIQNGESEYCHAPEWLDIYWYGEEHAFIKICREGKLGVFYAEAEEALKLLLRSKERNLDSVILSDALRLNRALIKLPFQPDDLEIQLDYNLFESWRNVVLGNQISLERKPHKLKIKRSGECYDSWEEWLRKLVWYSYRNGAYLYDEISTQTEPDIAVLGKNYGFR